MLSGHGLAVALESLAALAPVPVRLTVALEERLPEPVEVAAYYVVTESLANIGKHAQAAVGDASTSRARTASVVVEVVDDGVGGADTERGSGLRGLADRVEALGGRLRVWSPARRRHASAGRRCRAGSDRRGQRAAARGARAAARRRPASRSSRSARPPTSCC